MDYSKLKAGKEKVIMAVVQDAMTKKVLMVGVMNKDALDKTCRTGMATFWSRSRKKLWTKGETSGNYLRVERIQFDCDQDSLLLSVNPTGPIICHMGAESCFEQVNGTLNIMWIRGMEQNLSDT
ncbi:MAG: phosphoribosyl-AMP cyclohydrolase [bacterium]|nr:phosphoribosyl-AMP cyclohydrolase [bacterium]